jgi:hypothetical protein
MILVATAGLMIAGCSTQKGPAPNASSDSTSDDEHQHSDDHDHKADHRHGDADHDHAVTSDEKSQIEAAMAKLSAADRQVAQEQKVCPVSGEPLGSMGAPIKITVEGRELFVCCEGCVDELKENFDKYTAKLENAPAQ